MTKKERVSQIRTKISVLNKNCYFKLNEKIIRGWGGVKTIQLKESNTLPGIGNSLP